MEIAFPGRSPWKDFCHAPLTPSAAVTASKRWENSGVVRPKVTVRAAYSLPTAGAASRDTAARLA
jgi:hypothetical protein